MANDKVTLQRIGTGHPAAKEKMLAIYNAMDKALTSRSQVRYTFVFRTFKEQQDLYNLGRTVVNPDGKKASKPMGNIVTNAKAGQSIHNYGLAWDIALLIDGKELSWDTIKDFDKDGVADWTECVRIAKSMGAEWGGDWKTFKDEPHFQIDFGYSWQQLQALHNVGKLIPGTQYVELSRDPVPATNVYRTTTAVNFRTAGSTSSIVIMVIIKGEHVTELSRSGGWSKVVYNGKTGYLSSQYLTK